MPHYSHASGSTLCGRKNGIPLTDDEIAAATHVCGQCGPLAETIAARREDWRPDSNVLEMRQAASRLASRVRTNPDPDDPEWRTALRLLTATLDYLHAHDAVYAEAMAVAETERDANRYLPPAPAGPLALAPEARPAPAEAPSLWHQGAQRHAGHSGP